MMQRFLDILPRVVRCQWRSLVQPSVTNLNTDQDQKTENSLGLPPDSDTKKENQKPSRASKRIAVDFSLREHENPNKEDGKYRQRSNFWFPNRTPSTLIGWGALVALGLHFNKYKFGNQDIGVQYSLMQYIAYALPITKTAIFELDRKKPVDSHIEHEDEGLKKKDNFETTAQELVKLTEKYLAINHSMDGLKAANAGNYTNAVSHWMKSAKLGHSKSNFNLGLCYESGHGVTKNLHKSVEYYRLAAEQDHTQALYNLAVLYINGEVGDLGTNTNVAIHLLERAAELGLPQAQTSLGVYYTEEEQEDPSKAVEMFSAAAKQKEPDALFHLGVCFEEGWGVKCDLKKACDLYAEAAEVGHGEAMYSLASFYEKGCAGLSQDTLRARELYTKSADAGNVNSKRKLEELVSEGRDKKMLELFNKKRVDTLSNSSSYPVLKKITSEPCCLASILNNSLTVLNEAMFTSNQSQVDISSKDVNFYLGEDLEEKIEDHLDNYIRRAPHCCNSDIRLKPSHSFTDFVVC